MGFFTLHIYSVNKFNDMLHSEFANFSDEQILMLIIGLCILLRMYQSIYIETSVRNKCVWRFLYINSRLVHPVALLSIRK
jgi:hypothetical protein